MREGKREKRKEGLAKCVILSTGLLLCAALFLAVTPGHLATFSVAKDSDGQSTEMLKIFRVQVSCLARRLLMRSCLISKRVGAAHYWVLVS